MRSKLAFLAGVALMATTLAACGDDGASGVVGKAKEDKKLVIGIKTDQPGLGLQTAQGFTGFDVDVANYIAKKLGATAEFKKASSDVREQVIQQGDVDLVIATYSITDERKQKVAFAGPYLVTGQDILVKAGNTDITGVDSLKEKTVCGASGSSSPARLAEKFGGTKDVANDWGKKHLKLLNGYGACLPLLESGDVDAVSTDATILAGFAAQSPGKFKIVGQPFSEEKYGVGIKLDDKDGRTAVNDALDAMFKDGSWKAAVDKNFGEFGKIFATPPTVDRY